MNKKRIVFWGMIMLIGLVLTGCAGYYSGYGYYGNPYYNDYDYGYYAYPYYHEHHEFGQSPKWGGEHRGSGGHPASGEHHHDSH